MLENIVDGRHQEYGEQGDGHIDEREDAVALLEYRLIRRDDGGQLLRDFEYAQPGVVRLGVVHGDVDVAHGVVDLVLVVFEEIGGEVLQRQVFLGRADDVAAAGLHEVFLVVQGVVGA